MPDLAPLYHWYFQISAHGPAYTAAVLVGVALLIITLVQFKQFFSIIRGFYRHLTGGCDKNHRDSVDRISKLKDDHKGEMKELREHHDIVKKGLTEELEASRELEIIHENEISTLREQLSSIQERYGDITSGEIWGATPTKSVATFRPLALMQKPIISVFNLKGGVGKTTLSANLAATYWARGERVLLIDMDYQASLTLHCLTAEQIENLNNLRDVNHVLQSIEMTQETLPESWLNSANGHMTDHTILLNNIVSQRMHPIASTGSFILPTCPSMDAYEVRTMIKWMFRQTNDDVRFRLRTILHSDWLTQRFDRVIIDCPPRLTLASVNALAASHFVLIPAIPDILSTDTVPELFATLRRLRPNICADLKVLGVVANKGRKGYGRADLSAKQQDRLNQLGLQEGLRPDGFTHGQNTILKTWIPNKAAAEVDSGEAFDRVSDDLSAPFSDLALEIDKRIKNDARQTNAAVHS